MGVNSSKKFCFMVPLCSTYLGDFCCVFLVDLSEEKKETEIDVQKVTWNELIIDFTQNTTFHGFRYITLPTPYLLRK